MPNNTHGQNVAINNMELNEKDDGSISRLCPLRKYLYFPSKYQKVSLVPFSIFVLCQVDGDAVDCCCLQVRASCVDILINVLGASQRDLIFSLIFGFSCFSPLFSAFSSSSFYTNIHNFVWQTLNIYIIILYMKFVEWLSMVKYYTHTRIEYQRRIRINM